MNGLIVLNEENETVKRSCTWMKALLTIPVVLIFVSIGVAWWIWGGYEQSYIPNHLIPTAEFLMKQPVIEPEILNVFPRPGSVVKSSEVTYVCLHYEPQYEDRTKLQSTYNWTRLFLNGQRIPQSRISGSLLFGAIMGGCLQISYFSPSPSGLHLFRIQVGTSFNDFLNPDPKLSYEWAYRVE